MQEPETKYALRMRTRNDIGWGDYGARKLFATKKRKHYQNLP